MTSDAMTVIQAEQRGPRGVLVSPFTAWEVATLVSRGRFKLTVTPEVWFAALMNLPGFALAPMPPAVLIASTRLPGTPPRDPADRIIAATARAYGLTVITRDGELLPYAAAGHMRAIRC